MKKRFLALLLAVVMCLAMSAPAFAADKAEIKWLPSGMYPITFLEETQQILARNGNAWFLLDKSGNIVQGLGDLGYQYVNLLCEGLFAVQKENKLWGYVDINFQTVIPVSFNIAGDFHEGMAVVGIGDSWDTIQRGYIDKTGKIVIQPKYHFAYNFSEGLAAVEKDGLWGFVDKTGKEVIPLAYNAAGDFSDGLAEVRVGDGQTGKWGFIDKTGKMVIQPQYDFTTPFSEGLAGVENDSVSGYIDMTGKMQFTMPETMSVGAMGAGFSEGLAATSGDDGASFIDKTGKVVFHKAEFIAESGFKYGLASIARMSEKEEGFWERTFVNTKGEELFSEYYNEYVYWGSCGAVCKMSVNGDQINDEWGIFVNPYYTASQPQQPDEPDEPDEPQQPTLPEVELIDPTGTAVPTTRTVKLDGKDVEFQYYAIRDSEGNDTNYVKMRDLADALNGTAAQFNVSWDGKISIIPNTAYDPDGTENKTPYSGDQTYKAVSDTPVSFNGSDVKLTSFQITYEGGGYTYYKLRNLGQLLNFETRWDGDAGSIVIETDKPYTGK